MIALQIYSTTPSINVSETQINIDGSEMGNRTFYKGSDKDTNIYGA